MAAELRPVVILVVDLFFANATGRVAEWQTQGT
jgi:hypothetical protein